MIGVKGDDFLERDEAGNYYVPKEQQVRDEVEKNRWKEMGRAILSDWRLYLMLVPMVLVFLLWKYMPMYELTGCFKNPTTGNVTKVSEQYWVGLRYFVEVLNEPNFWRAFRNTFITAFYGLLFGFPAPIILALFFNEVKSNITRSIMQVCVYLPKFMSTVVVTSLALTLMRPSSTSTGTSYGLISQLLVWLHVVPESLANEGLVYTTECYRAIYVITGLWEHAGYDSIVFFAAVIAVSPTSYEAAQIDGAGKMQQMRYVVIPSILSTVVIMLIMKIGTLLSVGYEKIYLLEGGGNYEAADVVSTLANRWSSDQNAELSAWGIAAEMMNNLIGMLLVIGSNFIARRASDVSLY
ncbi:MAG: ABC transporter permease subunit [Candidatus Coproplasma sp.]